MTILTLAPNLPLPYAQDWNLNLEKSFGSDWLVQIGYVGTNGIKLPRFIEGNPTVFVPGVDSSGDPISNENNVNQRRLYSGCTLAQPNGCVYASAGLIAGIANSSYNALEASLRKRFGHGLSSLPTRYRNPSMTFPPSTSPGRRRNRLPEIMTWRKTPLILPLSAVDLCSTRGTGWS